MHRACTEHAPLSPTLAASGQSGHHDKGDDMYVHPLIHTELSRQPQLQLSRRRLQRSRRETSFKLGTLLIAILATLALSTTASAASATKPPHKGYTLAEVQAAAVASADVSRAANKTYVAVKYPRVWGVETLLNGNVRVELSIWIYGLSAQQGADHDVTVIVSPGMQIVDEHEVARQ
jgi:hypothetical protein